MSLFLELIYEAHVKNVFYMDLGIEAPVK